MHPYTCTLLGLALGLVVTPTFAALIGEVETNDSYATAQNLDGNFSTDAVGNIFDSTTVPHASVAGAIGPNGGINDVDYYMFTVAAAGSTGYFDIDDASDVSGGVFDSVLSLFDSGFNLLAFNSNTFPTDPGSLSRAPDRSLDSFLGTYTFGSADTYYLAVSSFGNVPLAFGNPPGDLTRPDGESDGTGYAGDSGPTNVDTANEFSRGTYTLHASLTAPGVTAVPEPGVLDLLGLGLAGLLALRRRAV